MIAPDMFVIVGARVVDLSGIVAVDQALAVAQDELEGLAADAAVAMIGVPGRH